MVRYMTDNQAKRPSSEDELTGARRSGHIGKKTVSPEYLDAFGKQGDVPAWRDKTSLGH